MFLPVACLKCGKLFQVPEAAAGTEVDCPWCHSNTSALPVAGIHDSRIPQSEPLSLDDEPASYPPNPDQPANRWFVHAAIATVAALAILALTVGILRYGSGSISSASWEAFTPPDGSCSIALPGTPTAETIEPKGHALGGEQYSVTGWYSRARVWFGWRDLDPGWVKQAALDRDGAITSPILAAERDLRKVQMGGAIEKEAMVRFNPNTGLEVQMDTPRGKLVERYILALEGPRPRLYFMGIEAKNASVEGASAQRLFNSFRINP
jgi:hypothetical protein